MGDEFCLLTGWSKEELLVGGSESGDNQEDTPRKKFIYEVRLPIHRSASSHTHNAIYSYLKTNQLSNIGKILHHMHSRARHNRCSLTACC